MKDVVPGPCTIWRGIGGETIARGQGVIMRKAQTGSVTRSMVYAGVLAMSSIAGAHEGQVVPVQMGHMGRGMMGEGMLGEGGAAAQKLRVYVRRHDLGCFSCHMIYENAAGPAFMTVAGRYAGRSGAEVVLAHSIVYGVANKWLNFPAMPAGLASPAQARVLAGLILDLRSDLSP